MNKTTEILQAVLGTLSVEDINELNNVVIRKQYPPDVIICHEGALEHTFYVIESGMVAVTRRMKDNQEQALGVLQGGQFFGEMGLLDDVPRAATIRTITDCTLIEISEQTFDTIVARNPLVAASILKGITNWLRNTDKIAIEELEKKNQALAQALDDLKAAQDQLVQQERLKRDLEIASDVQRSVLPTHFPEVPSFEFGVRSRPARQVGGDFYDVIQLTDNEFILVVADVSGKSWNAAMFMAIVRALLLREVEERLSPTETLHKLHDQIMKTSTAEMFVTLFYGVLKAEEKHLRFVRAGHEPLIVYRAATQTLETFEPPGRFIGLLPGLIVEEAETQLSPGDCLICYSDGITDAENSDGDFFGLDRLLDVIKENGHVSAQELADCILTNIDEFEKNVPQSDDITILVAKSI